MFARRTDCAHLVILKLTSCDKNTMFFTSILLFQMLYISFVCKILFFYSLYIFRCGKVPISLKNRVWTGIVENKIWNEDYPICSIQIQILYNTRRKSVLRCKDTIWCTFTTPLVLYILYVYIGMYVFVYEHCMNIKMKKKSIKDI